MGNRVTNRRFAEALLDVVAERHSAPPADLVKLDDWWVRCRPRIQLAPYDHEPDLSNLEHSAEGIQTSDPLDPRLPHTVPLPGDGLTLLEALEKDFGWIDHLGRSTLDSYFHRAS